MRPGPLVAGAVAVGALALWIAWRLGTAHAAVGDAVARSQLVERDLARLSALKGSEAQVVTREHAQTDLVSAVQKAMTMAGIPVAAFNGIQPLTDQTDAISHVQTRSVQVRLSGLRPSDLGAWIAAWQAAERAWGISGLAMTHMQGAQGVPGVPGLTGAEALDMNRFAVTVTLLVHAVEGMP